MSGLALQDASTRAALEKFDLLVLPVTAQVWNADFLKEAKRVHPNIILLAYVPTVSWNNVWTAPIYTNLKSGIQSSWWLHDASGAQISIWPNTEALNLTTGWSNYLANWTSSQVLSSGLWDGVFYDEVSAEISYVSNVDVNNDGKADDATSANAAWTAGLVNLFQKTRSLIGGNKIIVMNGSSSSTLLPQVNGRMFESFPTPWEAGGGWSTLESRYLSEPSLSESPNVFIVNGNTNNTGTQNDYQKMRFDLTSTLMGNGYFSYDFGTESHGQTWWYDEYDTFLGGAVASARVGTNGVWQRDFDDGKALTNPTSSAQTVTLDGDYEKLHGTQDPNTNNGRIVSSVTLPSNDGLLLLRPLDSISNAIFTNGSFVRIFNEDGSTKRNGFFAYNNSYTGGDQVDVQDLNHDGKTETVVAKNNQVFIYNNDGSLHASFYPYTSSYHGSINIAVGDLENDGSVEIVTGTGKGGGPQVRIFNKDGVLINPGFFAYDTAFRGGVHVAIGDLNGDGTKEIVAGAGDGGGPQVRIFNKNGKLINPGFFAYETNFRGGVNVAVGDLNGDGKAEIVTGAGAGGGPLVKIFDQDGHLESGAFFAYDKNGTSGVEVATADLDHDGKAEIIASSNDVFTLSSF